MNLLNQRADRFTGSCQFDFQSSASIAGTLSREIQMLFDLVRDPAKPDANIHALQIREFDRWRTAIELVQRMREAGFSCELGITIQDRPTDVKRVS